MTELKLVPKSQKKAYLCRHCRWSGLQPKIHNFGSNLLKITHTICPQCTAVIKQSIMDRRD